jgi:hypothetical protein
VTSAEVIAEHTRGKSSIGQPLVTWLCWFLAFEFFWCSSSRARWQRISPTTTPVPIAWRRPCTWSLRDYRPELLARGLARRAIRSSPTLSPPG